MILKSVRLEERSVGGLVRLRRSEAAVSEGAVRKLYRAGRIDEVAVLDGEWMWVEVYVELDEGESWRGVLDKLEKEKQKVEERWRQVEREIQRYRAIKKFVEQESRREA